MLTFLGDVALLNAEMHSEYRIDTPYIANNEYVICESGIPVPQKINLSSQNANYETVFGKKPIALVVANNHILDYGIKGFEETIKKIESQGVYAVGVDETWLENNVCLLAYSMFYGKWNDKNVFQFDEEKALSDIKKAKANGARSIIVNIHWGVENYALPTEEQKEIGHWLIDNGVSLVIGHHPHCVQPIEKYKDCYIFYSLGNCMFPPFNVNSHYDGNGVSHRKYRFNWRKWNNEGLSVVFDEMTNELIRVDEIKFKNNVLYCKKSNVSIQKYLDALHINEKLARLQFLFRKYWLFLVSNALVDGKIIDWNSIKAELKK